MNPQPELVDVWVTGHCGQQVVGESNYGSALRAAVAGRGRHDTGELDVEAVLVPEPGNRHDSNAVMVLLDGQRVGYLPRDDAPPYARVLGELAAKGRLARVPARLWWSDLGDGDWMASVSIDLAPADLLLPVNVLPRTAAVEIPRGGAMQVAGEDAHLDVLVPVLGGRSTVAVYVSLHEITERRPRSERQIVEVRIDGQRIGQLSPVMSEHMLALIRHGDRLGLTMYARAHVRGNALKAEVVLHSARAADLPQEWIAGLERPSLIEAAPVPAPRRAPAPLPPPGWYPNPAGPGVRWWDGASWTEHTASG